MASLKVPYISDALIFQKSRSHLKILAARRVTRAKYRTGGGAQILGATMQNVVWHLYTPVLVANVKLFLYTSLRRIGVVELQLHSFLTSGIDRDECLASRPRRLTPGKELRQPLNMRLGGP